MRNRIVIVGLLGALGGCGSSGGDNAAGGRGGAAGLAQGAGGSRTGTAGQGGAGGASACGPITQLATTSGGTMSWKDNGTLVCPLVVIAQRTTSTRADTFIVDASGTAGGVLTATGYAVDFTVASYSGLISGTYTCQVGNGTTAPYVSLTAEGRTIGGTSATSDCTVEVTFSTDSTGVERAQGTFSGSVSADGGTESITDGVFDITVSQVGG